MFCAAPSQVAGKARASPFHLAYDLTATAGLLTIYYLGIVIESVLTGT